MAEATSSVSLESAVSEPVLRGSGGTVSLKGAAADIISAEKGQRRAGTKAGADQLVSECTPDSDRMEACLSVAKLCVHRFCMKANVVVTKRRGRALASR